MKRHKLILLALTAAFMPAAGWSANDTTAPAPPPVAAVVNTDPKLSKPARDVVKMVTAGVSDDVVKAFVDNSPSTFNLTPDNIINLQGVGVSSAVTSEMLGHDKALRDQTALAQSQPLPPGQPPADQTTPYPVTEGQLEPEQNSASVYTIPADTSSYYYNDLAPYGAWDYLADYGWCWQPAYGLSYAYYPWGILRSGRWWNCPGRGWVWFPGSHFRGTAGVLGRSSGFGGTRGFVRGGNDFGTASHFSGVNHFGGVSHFGGVNHFGGHGVSTFVMHNSAASYHGSGGFHATGGFSHANVGHSFGGGGFSHSSASHGFGGGGFSHSGGGHSFGGGRGGGGHR